MLRQIVTSQLNEVIEFLLPMIDKSYNVVTLSGDLGAGKTSLVKQLLKAYNVADPDVVTSPSFNLLNIYDVADFEVWHYDLYRLNSVSEVLQLNFEEALQQKLTLIEWPELILSHVPENNHINIQIEFAANQSRIYTVKYIHS